MLTDFQGLSQGNNTSISDCEGMSSVPEFMGQDKASVALPEAKQCFRVMRRQTMRLMERQKKFDCT